MVTGVEVREFGPDDKPGFLDLYSTVFGERSEAWFNWKYVDNPVIDSPAIYVAESDAGELIGARPHVAMPLRYGGAQGIGLEPCDTMVHPDHRRQGVFKTMANAAIDSYAAQDYWCFFNFPNEMSRPADEQLGWKSVGELPTWLRINTPSAVAKSLAPPKYHLLGEIADPILNAAQTVVDGLRPSDSDVQRLSEPPIELMASLSVGEASDRIQLHRSREYLEWRFDRPDCNYSFYSTGNEFDVGAVLVTATESDDGITTTTIVDAVPQSPTANYPPKRDWSTLLAAVVEDHRDSDMIRVFEGGLPKTVLRRAGFLSSETPPLSVVFSPPHLYAYPFSAAPMPSEQLLARSNWELTFASWDVM